MAYKEADFDANSNLQSNPEDEDFREVKTPFLYPELHHQSDVASSEFFLADVPAEYFPETFSSNVFNENSTLNPLDATNTITFTSFATSTPQNENQIAYFTSAAQPQQQQQPQYPNLKCEFQNVDYFPNVSETNIKVESETNSVTSSLASKTTMKNKKKVCMNPNAVAARENRAKKKSEECLMKNRMQQLETEIIQLRKENNDLLKNQQILQDRNNYLEGIVTNMPEITKLINHIQKLPNLKLNNVNMHNLNHENQWNKKNISDSGICLHLKPMQQMSLQFCQICSKEATNWKFKKMDNNNNS